MGVHGREPEQAAIADLLTQARAGQGGSLVVTGEAGDRFLIFLGVLSLLADAGEQKPVLVVVDDAQWLDDASAAALQFVARRIAMEPVALLWAARENAARPFDTTDLPTLRLAGLGLAGAAAVLAEQAGGDVSPEVAALLVANTGGNPLA